jgi:2-polyprenyl-3-methyl-5-hydroxy-6-metoxy-1,4-benzoquinol methylase
MADDELSRERALVRAGWELVELLGRLDMHTAKKLLAPRWAADRARAAVSLPPLKLGETFGERIRKTSESPAVLTRFLRTLDLVQPGDRVFEIGPGRGYLAGLLLRDGNAAAYRGIDIGERNLQSTRELLELNGLADRGEVAEGDLRELTRSDVERFGTDLLLCCEVIEHVPEPERAIKILANALPPGADLLLTVPLLGRAEHVWGHISIFSTARIRDAIENAGLVVHTVDVVDNNWVFVLASHETGPSPRAARAAATSAGTLADPLPDDGVPRSVHIIKFSEYEVGPSRSHSGIARHHIERVKKTFVLCELVAKRRRWSGAMSYGGLWFPVSSPRGLRLQLMLDDTEHVTAFHVDGYAGADRVARWIWEPAARMPARTPPTFVLRPGVPEGYFRPTTKLNDLTSIDSFDIYAAIRPGSTAKFRVRAAMIV